MEKSDPEFMQMAITEARKCKAEDGRVHPLVGAVAVREGKVLASAHRGELGPGEHAEYTLLEKKLHDVKLSGSTVFVTLEPCTKRGTREFTPCADRLAMRRVSRVVIGMLDPNPQISGKGQMSLRKAGIVTELFPSELMNEIEELNRHFIEDQTRNPIRPVVDEEFLRQNSNRSLDKWYETINHIYWNSNYGKSSRDIFAHLVEVCGGLSLLASDKQKPGIDPRSYVYKALAWWLTLCGKVGIKSVERMLWYKFPRVCPYCQKSPHVPMECGDLKQAALGPDWEKLDEVGEVKRPLPQTLGEWQTMFLEIYPPQQTEDYGQSFGRLTEELGELAEALRVFNSVPGYFLSEACDVFAWLMHIQNIIDHKDHVAYKEVGLRLQREFCRSYPDRCLDCTEEVCTCPPVLPSTVGRIAHEVPSARGTFGPGGMFLPPDQRVTKFRVL